MMLDLRSLARGALVLSISRLITNISAFLALPLLARLLTPADFGVVSLAMTAVYLASSLADAGLGLSLVRVPLEDRETWSTVFWVNQGWSFLTAAVLFLLNALVAMVTGIGRTSSLLFALALLPVLQGILAPFLAELQQRGKFGTLAITEITATGLGLLFALISARLGGGAWALAAQYIVAAATRLVLAWSASFFRPQLIFKARLLKGHLRFGRDTILTSVLNLVGQQGDNFLVGRQFGAGPLGIYSMAFRLKGAAMSLAGGPLQSALYPRLIALREEPDRLRALVLFTTQLLALIITPPMMLAFTASKDWVPLVFGPKWGLMSPLIGVLAPIGALQVITGLNGVILMALDLTRVRARLTAESTALWVLCLIATIRFGVLAVAWAYAASFLVYLPRFAQLYLRPVGLGVADLIRCIVWPVLLGMLAAALHWTARKVLGASILIPFLLDPILLGLAYALCVLIMGRRMRQLLSKTGVSNRAGCGVAAEGHTGRSW